MKKLILALFLCATSAQQLHAQAKLPNTTTNATKGEQELLDLSKTKWTWMADKKVDSLAGVFAENCVFVHMGGSWEKA